jgi:hypothetical protein
MIEPSGSCATSTGRPKYSPFSVSQPSANGFGLVRGAVFLEAREHHARADRRRAIPRAVLRREDAAAIFLREHPPE